MTCSPVIATMDVILEGLLIVALLMLLGFAGLLMFVGFRGLTRLDKP